MIHNLADILPPPDLDFTWRAVRREDALAINRLLLEAEAVDQRGMIDTLEDRESDFEDPASNPATDSLLALTPDGQAAAIGWVFAPKEAQDFYIAFLWGCIHPAHRRRGLGEFILTWMEVRGRQILAERPTNLPHHLRMFIPDFLKDRIALFEKHGFTPIRYSYRMRRDLSQPIPEVPLPPGLRLEPWRQDLDDMARMASNEAFQDHWGALPTSPETWRLWFTGHAYFRPALSFMVLTDQDPNPVAGFTVNQIKESANQLSGLQEGWIQDLGVRRPWRKQGVASALLCASMRAFRQARLDYAGLGVDAENTTGAVRLYERLGFVQVQRHITYSKDA
jgi:mycothiol synthase